MWWFSRGKNVLTVGSVHLDTIALSRSADQVSDGDTEVGSIIHSVGGSAFNIAANLAGHRQGQRRHRQRRRLLDPAAAFGPDGNHQVQERRRRRELEATCGSTRNSISRRVRGGGYVGLLDEENRLTRKAVVDAAMHEADIFADATEAAMLHRAIRWADILVLDADLAVPTVNRIAEHAREQRQAAVHEHRLDAGRPAQLAAQQSGQLGRVRERTAAA